MTYIRRWANWVSSSHEVGHLNQIFQIREHQPKLLCTNFRVQTQPWSLFLLPLDALPSPALCSQSCPGKFGGVFPILHGQDVSPVDVVLDVLQEKESHQRPGLRSSLPAVEVPQCSSDDLQPSKTTGTPPVWYSSDVDVPLCHKNSSTGQSG